jgi:hypothetical protein
LNLKKKTKNTRQASPDTRHEPQLSSSQPDPQFNCNYSTVKPIVNLLIGGFGYYREREKKNSWHVHLPNKYVGKILFCYFCYSNNYFLKYFYYIFQIFFIIVCYFHGIK